MQQVVEDPWYQSIRGSAGPAKFRTSSIWINKSPLVDVFLLYSRISRTCLEQFLSMVLNEPTPRMSGAETSALYGVCDHSAVRSSLYSVRTRSAAEQTSASGLSAKTVLPRMELHEKFLLMLEITLGIRNHSDKA